MKIEGILSGLVLLLAVAAQDDGHTLYTADEIAAQAYFYYCEGIAGGGGCGEGVTQCIALMPHDWDPETCGDFACEPPGVALQSCYNACPNDPMDFQAIEDCIAACNVIASAQRLAELWTTGACCCGLYSRFTELCSDPGRPQPPRLPPTPPLPSPPLNPPSLPSNVPCAASSRINSACTTVGDYVSMAGSFCPTNLNQLAGLGNTLTQIYASVVSVGISDNLANEQSLATTLISAMSGIAVGAVVGAAASTGSAAAVSMLATYEAVCAAVELASVATLDCGALSSLFSQAVNCQNKRQLLDPPPRRRSISEEERLLRSKRFSQVASGTVNHCSEFLKLIPADSCNGQNVTDPVFGANLVDCTMDVPQEYVGPSFNLTNIGVVCQFVYFYGPWAGPICELIEAIAAFEPYCTTNVTLATSSTPLASTTAAKTAPSTSSKAIETTQSLSSSRTTTMSACKSIRTLSTLPVSTTTALTTLSTTTTTTSPSSIPTVVSCQQVQALDDACRWLSKVSNSLTAFCPTTSPNEANSSVYWQSLLSTVASAAEEIIVNATAVATAGSTLQSRITLATALFGAVSATSVSNAAATALVSQLEGIYSEMCTEALEVQTAEAMCATVNSNQFGCVTTSSRLRGRSQRPRPPRLSRRASSNPCADQLQFAPLDCTSLPASVVYPNVGKFINLDYFASPYEGQLDSIVNTGEDIENMLSDISTMCSFYAALEAFEPYCDLTQYTFPGSSSISTTSSTIKRSFSSTSSHTSSQTSSTVSSVSKTTSPTLSSTSSMTSTSTIASSSYLFTTTTASSLSPSTSPSMTTHLPTSSTKTSTSAVSTSTALSVSVAGKCGKSLHQTCTGGLFGACCSQYGYCGTDYSYCGSGCQSPYGLCGVPIAQTKDGFCGVKHRTTCLGSKWGACCSGNGRCGNGSKFCGPGCFTKYGTCD